MAAVSLSPAPHKLGSMTSRRVPLGNVPNAANSPFRAVAAAASKRTRDQVEAQEDFSYDFQPRAKRQALEVTRLSQPTPPRNPALQSAEGRVFNKRSTDARPGPFEQKLLAAAAAKGDKPRQRVERHEKASEEQKDDVRQWQKHYRKSFLSFVFYFESLPEDIRISRSKYIRALGAREEKFFSKEVTHVVTARPIPLDSDPKEPTGMTSLSSTSTSSQAPKQSGTINPSLLDRQPEHQGQPLQPRNRFTFEAATSRRIPAANPRDAEPRKGTGNTDILSKAKEMGMKVWSLDKLQRVTDTLLGASGEAQIQAGHTTRVKGAVGPTKVVREAELSRMLRNERINGPSDRDATVALNELVPFKGFYIYVRDMDERTKPILVRDFPKPPPDEYSEWPQFHSVGLGKCPFIPEADPPTRQEYEKAKAREEELRARARAVTRQAPRTRAATSKNDAAAESIKNTRRQRPLEESRDEGNAGVPTEARMPTQAFCPPPPINAKNKSPAKATRELIANTGTRLFGGEPAASGMQPSNITSAIRSQMISSTAAAPGAKAGTSKEVHGLKRKVLEKASGPALNSMQTKQRTVDPSGNGPAERTVPAVRQTRRQAQAPLIHIDEESTQTEEDEDVWMTEDVRSRSKTVQKPSEKKNAKPGYCENCKEKYDDFEDHIIGRKHRKLALTQDNWKDLDRLLAHLGRRLKEPDSDGF